MALSKKVQAIRRANLKIQKSNDAFLKMSKEERRVQLAKDVIAQIKASRLIAESGTWLDFEVPRTAQTTEQVSEVLKEIVTPCTGCAIGGLLLCAVDRTDKLKLSQLTFGTEVLEGHMVGFRQEDATNYLRKFFPAKQLRMIESAFESGHGALTEGGEKEVIFKPLIKDPSKRMIAVMKNIIDNDGTFIPPTLTKAEMEAVESENNSPFQYASEFLASTRN